MRTIISATVDETATTLRYQGNCDHTPAERLAWIMFLLNPVSPLGWPVEPLITEEEARKLLDET